ncbi:RNA polymerase sigma-70 factor [Puteibacter caeruleilacunae]|nr:RNA polymerase sigma-70 factor [Puteibacter caeruleilacunae]
MGAAKHDTTGLKNLEEFKQFFEDNYQVATMVAMRYVDRVEIAEDLTQEVFMSMWMRRDSLQLKSSLKNYLFSAVKKSALKYLEREKGNTTSLNEAIKVEDADEANYSKEELAVKVAEAIENLPTQCRRVFKLAYYDELSYNEIAEELEISVNTVKTQIKQAYRSLREQLSRYVFNLFFLFDKFSH